MQIPMLDEAEYRQAYALYREGMHNRETPYQDTQQRFKKFLDYYFEITGFEETEPNAILHHRVAQYGPPCENCGKPYRTPVASFCAACGHKRITSELK
jgi:hypothetical protein